jgi:hypothetical protein
MLRSKGPNSRVASGDLLERALRELETLREWITFHSPGGLESNLRRARVYEFAPIVISDSMSKKSR